MRRWLWHVLPERFKKIRYGGFWGGNFNRQKKIGLALFDLENDPAEQHDVAAKNPEVVKRLKAMFDKLDAQVPNFPPIQPKWKGIRDIKGGDLKYEPRSPEEQ